MLIHYIKIAFRNLLKSKGYAAINIFGLAMGIACCLLIVQHLRDELGYDRHHQHLDRLFRVNTEFSSDDNPMLVSSSPSPLAWELAENYPEVEAATRIMKAPGTIQHLVKHAEKSFFEQDGFLADSTFFRVLHYDFVEGNPASALDAPYNVVISTGMAERFFGKEKALGKTQKIGDLWDDDDYMVTGVFDPATYPTHIRGNFFMNMRSGNVGQRFYALNEWAGNNLYHTYIRLSPQASAAALEAKFPALVEEKAGQRLRELGFRKAHHLEPVRDIYLYTRATYPTGPVGDMTLVYLFAVVAGFVLLIACINFMNLATAKATVRAQEVGVRKVVGASRGMLSGQFLSEAFLYAGLAVLLAYGAAWAVLPIFNRLTAKELEISILNDSALALWLLGILLATGLLAGSYPAWYLSSFSPARIFRGKIGNRFSAKQVRKALVVIQFVVSIALIQTILVIRQQFDYMRHKELGFEPEAKIVVPLNTTNAAEHYAVLREAFLQNRNVYAVGGTSAAPGLTNIEDMMVFGEGMTQDGSVHTMRNVVDPGYIDMMQFDLLTGRTFDRARLADTVRSVVINERLMKALGYSLDDAVGRKIFWNWSGTLYTHQIIGVVRDFHAQSLRTDIASYMFIWAADEYLGQLVASVATDDLPGLIDDLAQRWETVNPGEPFDYFFLDDKLQQAYQNDRRVAGLLLGFTLLAIFISCLGLLGLAAFAAESRSKEIGVRKVLGASVAGIVGLLSKEFLLLVLLAFAVASPVAWYFMGQWLQDFAYRTAMPWWAFVAAGAVALVVAFLTVSYQSMRAALADPVRSLRSE